MIEDHGKIDVSFAVVHYGIPGAVAEPKIDCRHH
jgi:hypothetical protein